LPAGAERFCHLERPNRFKSRAEINFRRFPQAALTVSGNKCPVREFRGRPQIVYLVIQTFETKNDTDGFARPCRFLNKDKG